MDNCMIFDNEFKCSFADVSLCAYGIHVRFPTGHCVGRGQSRSRVGVPGTRGGAAPQIGLVR